MKVIEKMRQKIYILFVILFFAAVLLTIINYSRLARKNDFDYNDNQLSVKERDLYLKAIFKNVDEFKEIHEFGKKYFFACKNDSIIGINKFIYKPITCMHCSNLHYICGIKRNGEIKEVLNIETIIVDGRKLDEEIVNQFFLRFRNITFSDNIYDANIVESINNAEKSCYQIKKGISEMFSELEKMKKLGILL